LIENGEMNHVDLARTIAKATRSNPAAMNAIRDEFAALGLEIATNADAGREITSATVNGQSFSASTTMSKLDRVQLLDRVIWFYDNGIPSTSRTRVSFL
jgi:hypothetical protein